MASTKETSPLERAARALYQRLGTEIADPENGGEDDRWPEFVDDVRAVLQAIREPSEAMVEASRAAKFPVYRDGKDHSTVPRWQAMIDAALEEGPSA